MPSVGSISGSLYGTAFMCAASPSLGKYALNKESAAIMIAAAITGIHGKGILKIKIRSNL